MPQTILICGETGTKSRVGDHLLRCSTVQVWWPFLGPVYSSGCFHAKAWSFIGPQHGFFVRWTHTQRPVKWCHRFLLIKDSALGGCFSSVWLLKPQSHHTQPSFSCAVPCHNGAKRLLWPHQRIEFKASELVLVRRLQCTEHGGKFGSPGKKWQPSPSITITVNKAHISALDLGNKQWFRSGEAESNFCQSLCFCQILLNCNVLRLEDQGFD